MGKKQTFFFFDTSMNLCPRADGGAGGFDGLILADGVYDTVIYTTTGIDSGTISRDGDMITFVGLEPTTDSTAGNKVVDILDRGAT